ncbi:hypothetical protein PROFUN_13071 [Planoprotostelium fungivorum]|uniref:Uncharacterized protein n=1 Tax=Planoprotostelium fungivorum TaxID=1890364 RepID=A0A2P6N5G2_9EUKA|nr:hypothetical protein PROFUN_13071 [Planoprotostelium fungivorum]
MWFGTGLTPDAQQLWPGGMSNLREGSRSVFTLFPGRKTHGLHGIVFVTCVIYHWNQRISESQDQNNTWPTQGWYLFPPLTVCIRDECKLR